MDHLLHKLKKLNIYFLEPIILLRHLLLDVRRTIKDTLKVDPLALHVRPRVEQVSYKLNLLLPESYLLLEGFEVN